MGRSRRMNIPKGQHLIVLEDYGRRKFLMDDAAKNTIGHDQASLEVIFDKTVGSPALLVILEDRQPIFLQNLLLPQQKPIHLLPPLR